MAAMQVLRGILKSDGSLELVDAPNLPSGPVEVVLRSLTSSGRENWWEYLQRVRMEAEASGSRFRSRDEIEAERESFRDEGDRP